MKRLACPTVLSRLLPASNRLGGALCALALVATTSTGSAAQTSLTKYTASDPSASAWFGDNVSIDGDLAVVGAPGAESATIYRRMGGVWVEEKVLTAWEGGSAQFFGISSVISRAGDPLSPVGDVVAVGAVFHWSAGGALIGGVFTWRYDGFEWVEEELIEASDAKHVDLFAFRIALDRDLLVVGAPADELSGDMNLNTGTFYVFEFDGSTWVEKAELSGSGVVRADQFGGAVAVSGVPGNERIVIGAYNEDLAPGESLDNEGVTYVFERVSSVWTEVARIVALDADPQDVAGWAVAVSGDVVATSAILDDEANLDAGAVYVYRAPDWVNPVKVMAPGGAAGDRFGELVALDGDVLLVGALRAFGGAGAVYSYRWDGFGWPHMETIINPDVDAAGDGFGIVGLQGGTVVIGAWKDSEKGVDAGAAYFGLLGNTPQGMVVVNPSDSTTGSSSVMLEFSNVTGEGQTTVTSSSTGPPPPSGFQVGNQELYYEISTTATFTGGITICIQYDENDFGNEDNIVLHHYVGGMWMVPLSQTLDTGANVVCADVTSLSPFAILESVILDSDNDGLLDSTELEMAQGGGCPDPFNADSDGDTLLDGQEVLQGTNPCLADTDGDGVLDAEDPLPTEPGVTSGWLEDAVRTLATDIQNLDLTLFSGPNPNANSGRRGVLTNHATGAANAIAAGHPQSAIALLHSLLNRIDGTTAQDWMEEGAETTGLRAAVELLLDLLAL